MRKTLRTLCALLALLCALPLAAPAEEAQGIAFADPMVERRVREVLSVHEGPVTAEMMAALLVFSYDPINDATIAEGEVIRDLSDLAHCVNLEELRVTNQPIESVEPLRGLEKLTAVSLHGCGSLTDISALAEAGSLEELSINGVPVEDVSAILALPSLRVFNAYWGTGITDLSALAQTDGLTFFALDSYAVAIDFTPLLGHTGLRSVTLQNIDGEAFAAYMAAWPALQSLTVERASITGDDLQALAGHALTALCIDGCPIGDLSALAGQTALSDLRLTDCGITDITPLAALTRLDYTLDLRGNDITDISALAGMTALEYICLPQGGHYTAEDIHALLPQAVVFYGNAVYTPATFDTQTVGVADAMDTTNEAMAAVDAQVEALMAQYGTTPFWPLDAWLALDTLRVSLGLLDAPTHGLPTADEIPQEEAIGIAAQALMETCGLSQAEVGAMYPGVSFLTTFPDVGRAWQINFVPDTQEAREEGTTQQYNVALRADNGAVIDVLPPVE